MGGKNDQRGSDGTRSLANRIIKQHASSISHTMRRVRAPYHSGNTGRETRQGEAERTLNNGLFFYMDHCSEDNTSNLSI